MILVDLLIESLKVFLSRFQKSLNLSFVWCYFCDKSSRLWVLM